MKVHEFLKSIKPKDNVVIIFHNDADGICSCSLMNKMLVKTGRNEAYNISQPMPVDKNLIKRIQTTIPNKIIFIDLAIDQQYQIIKKIGGLCDILIIDHHIISKNMNSKNITHYNPRFDKKDIYQSASYLTYKICSEITDMSSELWIAAVGMIADYDLKDSADLVSQMIEKYKIDGKPYDSYFGRIGDMITAAKATNSLTCEQMVDIMIETNDYNEIEKSKNGDKMIDAYRKIEVKTIEILTDFEVNAEKLGNVILYELRTKYNLRSPISTKTSEDHPKKLVIIWQKIGNKIKLSGRNQDNIDVGKMLQKASEGLNASAGGHENAAGATLNEKDWEKFKEKLVRIVNG